MRNIYTLFLFTAAVLLFAACDNASIVQPTHEEDLSQDLRAEAMVNVPDADLVPGQYIVVLDDLWGGEISEEVGFMARELISTVRSDFAIPDDSVKSEYEYALRGFTARMSEETAERLREDVRVDYVVQDWKMNPIAALPAKAAEKPNIARSSGQITPWGVSRVNGPLNGTSQTAWILDTGIDLDHRSLNVDVTNSASFIAEESADDYHGHGTHVAGSLAAINNDVDVVGVAAGTTVVSVKVIRTNGDTEVSEVVDGVNYVAGKASSDDIINMSLGFYTGIYDTGPLDDAVQNAADSGLRFAIAAQNWSINADNSSPGRVVHDNVWTVSAFRQGDEFVQTFDGNTPNCNPNYQESIGSNYGNPPISFSGPGENVHSLWKDGGTRTTCGTSMATPHIAGLLLASADGIAIDGYVSNDPSSNADPIAVAPTLIISPSHSVYDGGYPRLDWSEPTKRFLNTKSRDITGHVMSGMTGGVQETPILWTILRIINLSRPLPIQIVQKTGYGTEFVR